MDYHRSGRQSVAVRRRALRHLLAAVSAAPGALPRSVEILPLEQEPAPTVPKNETAPYAWVDCEAGIVRIPVEEAMNIVVQTLPVDEKATSTASKREQRSIPTDAGAGRIVIYPDESSQ